MSASSVNEFGQNVLQQLFRSQNFTGNVAFSGVSLYVTMAILSVGLREKTAKQLADFMGNDFQKLHDEKNWKGSESADELTRLRKGIETSSTLSSVLFHGVPVHKSFEQISKDIFGLELDKIDFTDPTKAMNKMNKFVEKATKGMLKDVFKQPMEQDTLMVLINVLYFYGEWEKKFSRDLTSKKPFETGQEEVMVDMMYEKEDYQIYLDDDNNVDYIFLSFKREGLYGVVVLPRPGIQLKDILNNKSSYDLNRPFELSKERKARLELPKFNFMSELNLVQTFMDNNVSDLFTRGQADMSGMISGSGFVGSLIQVAKINVDETGTTASAATVLRIQPASLEWDVVDFFVRRPFVYHIYHSNMDLILFSAIVTNPNLE
ncbi:Antithrombin-III [Thelohanellus kitauei]|uniref:Antithrombin-III n=1 Tax=Thelohanellus kitauei TaxID=669202 RepID=A0A0C2N9U1_THEKT|nr:Antithrombin-III [Thelohanellus kitauei]